MKGAGVHPSVEYLPVTHKSPGFSSNHCSVGGQRQRQEIFHKFETSQVYIASPRPGRALGSKKRFIFLILKSVSEPCVCESRHPENPE